MFILYIVLGYITVNLIISNGEMNTPLQLYAIRLITKLSYSDIAPRIYYETVL
jgi:hypothetical protein